MVPDVLMTRAISSAICSPIRRAAVSTRLSRGSSDSTGTIAASRPSRTPSNAASRDSARPRRDDQCAQDGYLGSSVVAGIIQRPPEGGEFRRTRSISVRLGSWSVIAQDPGADVDESGLREMSGWRATSMISSAVSRRDNNARMGR